MFFSITKTTLTAAKLVSVLLRLKTKIFSRHFQVEPSDSMCFYCSCTSKMPFNRTVPVPEHISLFLKSFCLSYGGLPNQAIGRRVGARSRVVLVKREFFFDICSTSRDTILIVRDAIYTKLSWIGLIKLSWVELGLDGGAISGCSMTLQTW